MEINLLSFIIFLPVFAAFILLVSTKKVEYVRNIAFIVALIVSVLILKVFAAFEPENNTQFVVNIPWIANYGITYNIGLDGFSLVILLLIAILIPTLYLFLWNIQEKGYWINILFVQTGLTGAILSLDIVLFYVFWEFTFLSIFLMSIIFTKSYRVFLNTKAILSVPIGVFLMFFSIIYLGIVHYEEHGFWSFQYQDIIAITTLTETEKIYLFFGFLFAFAIKIPFFPFHAWLVEISKKVPISVVFLIFVFVSKIGIYAIIRFFIPLFDEIFLEYSNYFVFFGIFSLIYFLIAVFLHNNLRTIFVFFGIFHIALAMIGVFSLNTSAFTGVVYGLFAHSVAIGVLFLLMEALSERKLETVESLNGILRRSPFFVFAFAVFLFSSIGFPITSGFVAELLIIFGIFEHNKIAGYIAIVAVLILSFFVIRIFQRIVLKNKETDFSKIGGLEKREILSIVVPIVLIFLMGIFPEILIGKIEPTITHYFTEILKLEVQK